jgi:hypothetical protein
MRRIPFLADAEIEPPGVMKALMNVHGNPTACKRQRISPFIVLRFLQEISFLCHDLQSERVSYLCFLDRIPFVILDSCFALLPVTKNASPDQDCPPLFSPKSSAALLARSWLP